MNLRPAYAKNNFGRKDIHHFGVNIYNNLPLQIAANKEGCSGPFIQIPVKTVRVQRGIPFKML